MLDLQINKNIDETISLFETLDKSQLKTRSQRFLRALQSPYSYYSDFNDDDIKKVHLYLKSRGISTRIKQPSSKKKPKFEKMDFNDSLKNHFYKNLPYRPYCSSDLAFGSRIRSKNIAIKSTHLQHNSIIAKNWLVLDYDKSNLEERLTDKALPRPNLAVINPENGHSHLFYALQTPVLCGDAARIKPLEYLAAVEYSLCKKWGADHGYSGLLSKNPLHEHWKTQTVRKKKWSLGDLSTYLTLESRPSAEAATVGLGRNCTLYETLRKWAYVAIRLYRADSRQRLRNVWENEILEQAERINAEFPEPLSFPEIKATAKSIAKYCWNKDPEVEQKFIERQSERGKASGLARAAVAEQKRAQARILAAKGLSQRAIAKELSIPQSSVNRYLKD